MFRAYEPKKTSNKNNPYDAICEIFGISLSQLAQIAGTNPATLKKWMASETLPAGKNLIFMSMELGISIDCLLHGHVVLLDNPKKIPWHIPFTPSAIVLHCFRTMKCLSLQDFAKELGFSVDEIIAYESGQMIPKADAEIISSHFGIPLELLYGYVDYYCASPDSTKRALIALAAQYSSDAVVLSNLLQKALIEGEDI